MFLERWFFSKTLMDEGLLWRAIITALTCCQRKSTHVLTFYFPQNERTHHSFDAFGFCSLHMSLTF